MAQRLITGRGLPFTPVVCYYVGGSGYVKTWVRIREWGIDLWIGFRSTRE